MQLSRGANDDIRWVIALTYEALGMHDRTLSVIEDAPAALVTRLNQTLEMAELRRLPRFQELRNPGRTVAYRTITSPTGFTATWQ